MSNERAGVVGFVIIVLLMAFVAVILTDQFTEISIGYYKEVISWVEQEPSLKPQFDKAFEDKRIIGTEYSAIKESYKELKRVREINNLWSEKKIIPEK